MPPVTQPAYPLVNGARHDWSSIYPEMDGIKLRGGIRAISYKHGLDYQHIMAGGKQPVGDTTGTYSAEGSFEMLLTDYLFLIQQLGSKGLGYMEQHFNCLVKYAQKRGDQPIIDELRGCRIKDEDRSYSQSNEGLVVKATLGIQLVLPNGNKALTDMIGV